MGENNYWIMQTIKGVVVSHGPYRTEEGRNNALSRVRGGEVVPFDSWESNPDKARDDYKSELIRVEL